MNGKKQEEKKCVHESKVENENVPIYAYNTNQWLDEIHEGQKLWLKSLGRDTPHKKDDEKD